MNKDHGDKSSKGLNDTYIILINAIPFIFDFIAGIFSIFLVYRIAIFNDLIAEKNKWAKNFNVQGLKERVFILLYEL